MQSILVQAPINIAVIKYWGKSNEELIIPCNDSISMTIESSDLYTQTLVQIDPTLLEDTFKLNGHPGVSLNKRIRATIDEARRLARTISGNEDIIKYKLRIESTNTVPTAAGLASSASGIAALAYALIKLYQLESAYSLSDLSSVARIGSGSACRSLLGGLVHWHGGSVGQITERWDGLNGFVVVLDRERKKVASTEGMQQTVKTSSLFHYRVGTVVPERVIQMIRAINQKDFPAFALIAMKDSNSFHACCLDTFPPISYLTPDSMRIIAKVHEYNSEMGRVAVGYTFDAGPNAVIFGLGNDPLDFMKTLNDDCQIIKWKLGTGPTVIHHH